MVSNEEIKKSALKVIRYKGFPFSETEFNNVFFVNYENLKNKGATKKQLEEFQDIVKSAPTKSGKFNPWSGD